MLMLTIGIKIRHDNNDDSKQEATAMNNLYYI